MGTVLHHGSVIATIAIALAVIVGAIVLARRLRPRPPLFATPVLTRAEIAFHARLVRAARRNGVAHVFAQVSMAAIMDADRGMDARERKSLRNRFDRKIVDFVLCDADTNVLLVVELDDRTHDGDRDRARDALVAAAGHRTMRIRGADARDDGVIARMVGAALPPRPPVP